MKIDFKTCVMYDGNEWVVINDNFDSLFKKNQKQGFAQFYDIIDGEDKWGWVNHTGEPIGGLHDRTEDFVNDFARFYDIIDGEGKMGWVNRTGEPIGGLHDWTDNFVNDFARFRDEINGKDKWGWVNRKGEPIGGLHDRTWDFVNDFARFKDNVKWGYSNEIGLELRRNDLKYDSSAEDYTILKKMESKLLHDFPKGSMKRFILGKMLN